MTARTELAQNGSAKARGSDRLQASIRTAVSDRMQRENLTASGVREACGINAGQLRQWLRADTSMTLGNLVKLEQWLTGETGIDRHSNALAHCADQISYRLIFGDGHINRADLTALARHLRASK